jgi:LysM repeat protein
LSGGYIRKKIYLFFLWLALFFFRLFKGLVKLLANWLPRFFIKVGLLVWRLLLSIYSLVLITRTQRRNIWHNWLPSQLQVESWFVIFISILAALFVLVNNIRIRSVNAGDFGQNSLLLSIVQTDSETLVEDVSAPPVIVDNNNLIQPNQSVDNEQETSYQTIEEGSVLVKPNLIMTERGARRDSEIYLVQAGDTLSSIANRFGVSVVTLLWENKLTAKSSIRIGQKLIILPTNGVSYRIVKGDTLKKIATRYKVDAQKISDFNNLSGNLRVGQIIIIPGGRPYVSPVVTRPAVSSQNVAQAKSLID